MTEPQETLQPLQVSVPPGADMPAAAPQPLQESHGQPPRGADTSVSSPLYRGRYGRLFRRLPVKLPSPESLAELAQLMVQSTVTVPSGGWQAAESDTAQIAAGYTYLGQFIDHDITFDPVSSLQRQNDPDALVNFRTPRLDLDSVYGRGPADDPFLYEDDGVHLRLGKDIGPDGARDLPRDRRTDEGSPGPNRALVGDPRNDENKIVAQLHVVFLRFHNAVVDKLSNEGLSGENLFKQAQRLVRWHYQWLVLHDFLPTILGEHGEQLVEDGLFETASYLSHSNTPGDKPVERTVRRAKLLFYEPETQPFIPLEFSVAAYRFGHSMIREAYQLNDNEFPGQPVQLFNDGATFTNLNGFGGIPDRWGIRWKHFFGPTAQKAMRIDASLAAPLSSLPGPPAEGLTRSLAERNLIRGLRLSLPSGESVARAMGVTALNADQLQPVRGALPAELVGNTPLWYYLLKEAEVCAGGLSLGPAGGRIVSEVLVGLVTYDSLSYLRVDPAWAPEFGNGSSFTVHDLLSFSGSLVN